MLTFSSLVTDNVVSLCLFQSLGLAHFVWITPLQCILCVGLIWELIEVNGFCALAALTLLGLIQAWLSQKMGPHRWGRTVIHILLLWNISSVNVRSSFKSLEVLFDTWHTLWLGLKSTYFQTSWYLNAFFAHLLYEYIENLQSMCEHIICICPFHTV